MKLNAQKIITVFLLAAVLYGYTFGHAYQYADELAVSVAGEIETEKKIRTAEKRGEAIDYAEIRAKDDEGENIPTVDGTCSDFLSDLTFKRNMVDFNGALTKKLHMREIYKDNGGIVLNNGYVVGVYPATSTDYEMEQIMDLWNFLEERDIPLLYVNEPTKYVDDNVVKQDLGLNTYINSNTDKFLSRLDENGIAYIDLREQINAQNSFQMFYKTDHHWTVPAGKLAAETIAAYLNDNLGYQIDISLYDEDRFSYTEYKDAWLGEQGKKLGQSYVGLNDFTLVLPTYDTLFDVTYRDNLITGSFEEVLVNRDAYLPENNSDIYKAKSWHYSYMSPSGLSQTVIRNKNNSEGKSILLLGDSFDQITVPFLALGVSEVQALVLRDYKASLKEYIDNHDIDVVIVAYASFMIGAHDNESSANYTMFDFQ